MTRGTPVSVFPVVLNAAKVKPESFPNPSLPSWSKLHHCSGVVWRTTGFAWVLPGTLIIIKNNEQKTANMSRVLRVEQVVSAMLKVWRRLCPLLCCFLVAGLIRPYYSAIDMPRAGVQVDVNARASHTVNGRP